MSRITLAFVAGARLPALLQPQATSQVVTDAYRSEFRLNAVRIVAAADDMPPDRYAYRPTPAQISFAEVVVHVLEGNYKTGAVVGGISAPKRAPVRAGARDDAIPAAVGPPRYAPQHDGCTSLRALPGTTARH